MVPIAGLVDRARRHSAWILRPIAPNGRRPGLIAPTAPGSRACSPAPAPDTVETGRPALHRLGPALCADRRRKHAMWPTWATAWPGVSYC